ncbi:cytochrome c3 family protein [Nitrospirota bacterium]
MKKILVIALTVVLSLALASIAFAGISGSKHDLSSGVGGGGAMGVATTQVCVFCHHPHQGDSTVGASVLLWNIDSVAGTFSTYTGSTTIDATANGTTLDSTTGPQSYLCMACHDGAVAANSLVAAPDNGTDLGDAFTLTGGADLAYTLVDDHPVNFSYDADLVARDTGIATVAAISATYPLYAGKMQCATCHDVHAGAGDSQDANIDFMRGNTSQSDICTDCHTNK